MGKGYEGLNSKYMLVYLLLSVAIICDLWEKKEFILAYVSRGRVPNGWGSRWPEQGAEGRLGVQERL